MLGVKLKVLLRRVEAKDYRDIAALLRAGIMLGDGLGAATALYGAQFPPCEALKALVYFEGGDLDMLEPEIKDLLTGPYRPSKARFRLFAKRALLR